MKLTRLAAFLAVLCLSLFAVAQEKPATDQEAAPPSTATHAKATRRAHKSMYADASPEMKKLTQMMSEAVWKVEETMPPSEMMPNGGRGTGEAIIHRGPGGNSLLQRYRSQSAMGRFSGHGITWYDAKAKGYRNIWCDSMTPTGCEVFNGTGQWEGDKLVFTGTQDMMGKTMQVKETISDITPNSFTFTIDSGPDAASMKNFMTIKYTKSIGTRATHDNEPAAAKP